MAFLAAPEDKFPGAKAQAMAKGFALNNLQLHIHVKSYFTERDYGAQLPNGLILP